MTRYSTYGSSRKDKTGLYFVMIIIFGFLVSGFGTWAIVEFILYLVKDNPFSWWSLGLTIVAIVGEIYYFIKSALSD